MPCYRCGVRQGDPTRGPSPWRRGVRTGAQVLICPECQHGRNWTADLDRCRHCGSTTLHRVLAETTCRSCGATGDGCRSADPVGSASAGTVYSELADDVAAALERVLSRGVH